MKRSSKHLVNGCLVFCLTAPVAVTAAASPPPEYSASSCVEIDALGPGLDDAPTMLRFELVFEAEPDGFTTLNLSLDFAEMVDDSPELRGDEMQARFVGEAEWTNFQDPFRTSDCADNPECDAVTYGTQVRLPNGHLPSPVLVELRRTGGDPEQLDRACLRVNYTASEDNFVDSPDLGPPDDGSERDASEPGSDPTVIDASLPSPGDNDLDPVPDQGLPNPEWADAGTPEPQPEADPDRPEPVDDESSPRAANDSDEASGDASEQNLETSQSCSAVRTGPAPWLLAGLLLPLLRARRRSWIGG